MKNSDTSTRLSEVSEDFLKSIYFDATQTIRHYDGLRASFTQIFASLLAIASSAVTAATVQGILAALLPVVSGLLAALSLLSLIIVTKIGSLIGLQRKRAQLAMQRFQDVVGEHDFASINYEARRQSSKSFVSRMSLGTLWAGIFGVIFLMNVGVLIILLTR